MNSTNLIKLATAFAMACAVAGCMEKQPDVVVTPPSTTTIIHDRTPVNKTVVVSPPPATHTDTHTNTNTNTTSGPPDTQSTSTSTTTTGGN